MVTKDLEKLNATLKERSGIIAIWHNRLLLIPYFSRHYTPSLRYSPIISNSRDADPLIWIIRFLCRYDTIIRVPHTSRAHALKTIVKTLKKPNTVAIITPDGPRGPRYTIKPGVLFASRVAKAPILPFTWSASSYWELGTWDRMIIPKPFSRITFSAGEPIEPPPRHYDKHAFHDHVQKAMMR
jgi:lysophospholipid acyltransferase (LPLAT)-like uncharacterized protein